MTERYIMNKQQDEYFDVSIVIKKDGMDITNYHSNHEFTGEDCQKLLSLIQSTVQNSKKN